MYVHFLGVLNEINEITHFFGVLKHFCNHFSITSIAPLN